MTPDLFPEIIDRSRHGAVWWTGRYQCRNWHGFHQSREDGEGQWLFHVRGFSDGPPGEERTAWVLTVNQETTPGAIPCPIDEKHVLTICDQRFSRNRWCH